MATLAVFPNQLQRSVAPEALRADQARLLERAEVDWLGGRLRRGLGMARANLAGENATVWSCGAFESLAGRVLVFEDEAGAVQLVGAPLPLWEDPACFGGSKTTTLWGQTFDEDGRD